MTDCVVQTTPMEGEFTVTGLRNGGAVIKLPLVDTNWTQVDLTAIPDINACAIQNQGAVNILLAYSGSAATDEAMIIYANGGERQYTIKNTITLYLRSVSGATNAHIELLS